MNTQNPCSHAPVLPLSSLHRRLRWLPRLAAVAWLTMSASAAEIVWTNSAGGLWSAATNWSPNQVPGPTDAAIITNAGVYAVHLNVAATVASLHLGGASGTQTLTNASPTLTLSGSSLVGSNGFLALTGGTLANAGTLAVQGRFEWTGGAVQSAGQTTVAPTASFAVSSGAQKTLRDQTITVQGAAVWSGGVWYGGYGAVFNVASDATLDVTTEAGAPLWFGQMTLNNAGTLRKTAGTGQATFGWAINNAGTVESQSGTLACNGGGAQSGVFLTGAAANRVHFGGGTHDLLAGVGFAGPGQFSIGDSGFVRVAAPLVTGARWSLQGNGSLGGTNGITFTGPFDWQAGTLQDAGQTIFSPTAAVTLSTAGQKQLRDRTVTLAGNATWSGGVWYGGYGAAFNVAAGATLEVATEAGAPLWFGQMTLNNAGTLRKTTGTGQATFGWAINNSGTVESQSGTLACNGGGAQSGVFLTGAAANRVHFGGGTHDLLAGVSFGGPGQFSIGDSGFVRVAAPLVTGARWSLQGTGSLGGTNAMTFTGPFDWQAGTMQDAGQTTFSPTAAVTLSTAGQKQLRDRTVTLAGNAVWSGGVWYGGYGAVFNIAASATLEVATEAGAPLWFGQMTLNNSGTLRKTAGTGQATFGWTIHNSGTVESLSGTLACNGGGTQSGVFLTGAAANRVHFGGGTHDLLAGVSFAGPGQFSIGDSGSVRVAAPLVTGARWSLQGNGSLGGTNSVTFTGPFDWQAGTMQDAGQTVFSPTAVVTLSTAGQKQLRDRTVTLAGNAVWSGGVWYGGYGAVFNVASGATLDVTTEAGAPLWFGQMTLNNAGTLRKTAGTGQATFGWAINNSGTVESQAGTLACNGGGAQSGVFLAGAAANRVHFGGGTHDLLAGVSFAGPGQFSIGDSGFVRVAAPLVTGARWSLQGNGSLGGTNAVTFTGPFDWQAGTMQDAGQTVFGPTAAVTLSTAGQKQLRDRTVTLGGNATWSGGVWYGGFGAVFNIASGATLDVASEAGAPVWFGNIALNNSGTLRKTAGTGLSFIDWPVTNYATVRAQSGTLGLRGIYVQRSGETTLAGGHLSGATFDLQGGVLTGAGNVAANVLNRARVAPGSPVGVLSLSNSPAVIYSNTIAGQFDVQLGGLVAGTEHDQLRVTGTANLSGTLNVSLLNDFVPAVGNSFTVMTYTARSGQFSNVVAPDGILLQAAYLPKHLVLNAVDVTQVPPYLIASPTNLTLRAGLTATFRVVAGGTPTLAYQWQRNSTNLPGATADTLVIPNVTVPDAGAYRVLVSNLGGFTNSANALLLVEPGFNPVEINTGFTNVLTGVSFFNGLHGAIIGAGGWLQTTRDGGVTWQVVDSGMTSIADVQFVGGAMFIAGVGPHAICVSYDGGLTWSAAYSGPQRIRRLRFLDATHGYAVGDAGAILAWDGASWIAMSTGIPVNLWSLDYCGGIPVAVGEAGQIYRFEGTNWVLRYTAVNLATLNDVRFCGSGGTGFAVGTGGVIYRTTDCGLSWEPYTNPAFGGSLNSITFGNCQTWWAAGDDGVLLQSTDGGLTWGTLYSGTTSRITQIVFVDGYGYYVDADGLCHGFTYAPIPRNRPPVVSLIQPLNGATNWPCVALTVRAQAADSDGFVAGLEFYANGQFIGDANPLYWTGCDLGNVTFTARATDNRGAVGLSEPVKVTYVLSPLHQLIPGGFGGVETNRAFKLCLTGELGRSYELFAHTNVAAPFAEWEAIGLMTPTNQLFRFRDYDATNYPYRFYRARQVANP